MKYPGGVKMSKAIKDISYGNRGMSLEEDLNISNSYYVDRGVAFIYKNLHQFKLLRLITQVEVVQ